MKQLDHLDPEALAGPPVRDLDSAKDVEKVTAADVRAAQAAAVKADAAATEAEHQALIGKGDVDNVTRTREHARFAHLRARLTARRAERHAAAERIRGLGAVADGIDALADKAAAGPGSTFEEAARQISRAAEVMRRAVAEHDARLQALVAKARELNVEPPAPTGPRASSAHVTLIEGQLGSPASLVHGRREVHPVGAHVETAIAEAVQGNVDAAVKTIAAVNDQPEPIRPEHLFIRTDGMIFEGRPEMHADALAKKLLRELTDAEIDRYMNGTLDGHH